jgi:hypothetical protein
MIMKKIILSLFIWLYLINSASAALSIDGSVTGTTVVGSTQAVSLSTSNTDDIIYCFFKPGGGAGSFIHVTGVADSPAGLTWQKRAAYIDANNNLDLEGWYAISTSKLSSDTITATTSVAPTTMRTVCFGVTGANLITPFDTNGSIPSGQSSDTLANSISETISTNNANDMLIGQVSVPVSFTALTRPSGFNQILSTGSATDASDNIVSSTLSSSTLTWSWTNSAAEPNTIMVDAIMQASSAAPTAATISDNPKFGAF